MLDKSLIMGSILLLQAAAAVFLAKVLERFAWHICRKRGLSSIEGRQNFCCTTVILAAVFPLAAWRFGLTWELLFVQLLLSLLYLIALTDWYAQMIPDVYILTAAVITILSFFVAESGQVSIPALCKLIGNGMLTALPLLMLTLFFESCLKKELFGGGDLKLLFVLGMCLGWEKSLFMLLLSCIISLFYVVKNKKSTIAFGPFLAIGTVIVLFL